MPLRNLIPILLLVSACALGCAASVPVTEAEAAELMIGDGLPGVGPITIAEFPQGFQIHSVDGDTSVLFAVQPSDAPGISRGIHTTTRPDGLLSRFGRVLADVAPPPEGWATPLSILVEDFERQPLGGSRGTFLVLDAGVTPVNIGLAPARLYRYSYRYRRVGGLTTTLLETHLLPVFPPTAPPGTFPYGLVYPGAPAILPSGQVAVPDPLVGAIWVSDTHLDNWTMALLDPRLGAVPGPSITGLGLDEDREISEYTYTAPPLPGVPLPPGWGIYPGIHSAVYATRTDEVCFPVTASPGGIYCMPLAALLDQTVPPFAKGATLRALVPPTPGVSDLTDGVAYDRFAPYSPWLYWQRAPADEAGGGCNMLRRVHLETGVIQELACDNEILSWANEIAALPPLIPGSPFTTILSSVGQQYNNPEVNFAITTPSYFSPSRMPIVVSSNH